MPVSRLAGRNRLAEGSAAVRLGSGSAGRFALHVVLIFVRAAGAKGRFPWRPYSPPIMGNAPFSLPFGVLHRSPITGPPHGPGNVDEDGDKGVFWERTPMAGAITHRLHYTAHPRARTRTTHPAPHELPPPHPLSKQR